jgi:hypothetical protein
MATLDELKQALQSKATSTSTSSTQPLSETQYSAGFQVFQQAAAWGNYRDFIIPQLSQRLTKHFTPNRELSILEVGPGSRSVLGHLPLSLRQNIKRYTAYEPNNLFTTELTEWLATPTNRNPDGPFPLLKEPADIKRLKYGLVVGSKNNQEWQNVVLFCHGMYGMTSKRRTIKFALEKLAPGGLIIVFHRDSSMNFEKLVCRKSMSWPTGTVRVADDDETLDSFARFVAGSTMSDTHQEEEVRVQRREICRDLGRRDDRNPGILSFGAPDIMVVFNQRADKLGKLDHLVSMGTRSSQIKNSIARFYHPATVLFPSIDTHVMQSVQWARDHELSLTVVGGSHSGQCVWPSAVALDMSALNKVIVITKGDDKFKDVPLVVAEAGCKTIDIVQTAMDKHLTVPLGARPSVGAGLWLQGGFGHLARLHGLASDSIVGAVLISPVPKYSATALQYYCVGHVPKEHRPENHIRPENEDDLLWAIKGAGTNFGVVLKVVFKAYTVPTYFVRNRIISFGDDLEAIKKLDDFDNLIASRLPDNRSADAYLYWTEGKLHLGLSMFETVTAGQPEAEPTTPVDVGAVLGLQEDKKPALEAHGVELFDKEMYMSELHGGHGGGKTSSFKRCVFLKGIGRRQVAESLIAAIHNRPGPFCYLHLLQGGGAVNNVAPRTLHSAAGTGTLHA